MKLEAVRLGFEENIKQGIAEGFYRENLDVELVSLFHAMQMKTTIEMMQETQKKYSRKRLLDFYIDLLIHLIANEKGMEYVERNYLNDTDKEA